MRVITSGEYSRIRKKLISKDVKIVKTGIQEMLGLVENNKKLAGAAIIERNDFKASVVRCLESDDYDLRKWTYHLLCLQPLPFDDVLQACCLRNIQKELDINNYENISWILSVLSANIPDESKLLNTVKNNNFIDLLKPTQIALASSCYRLWPIESSALGKIVIDYKVVCKIADDDDSLSAIWITKLFSNQFVKCLVNKRYFATHAVIPNDVFYQFLFHENATVRKYTMWAFAQDFSGGMDTILPYLPYCRIKDFETGVQKWYYVKMFQDKLFVHANRDIVQDIQYKLANLEPPVREGILMGCKKAGYDSDIADLIIEWEQANLNDPDNTVISLYQYIAKYSNQDDDFREILQSALSNQSLVALIGRDTIQEYKSEERKGGITLNIKNVTNLGNMQITEKGDNYLVMDDQGIDRNVLLAQIVGLQTKLDNDLYTEESYEALLSHLDYEFAQYRDLNNTNEYNRLNNSFEEVKAEKEEAESKDKLKKFLSVASSIVSLVTATPKVIELVSKVVIHIGNIFK